MNTEATSPRRWVSASLSDVGLVRSINEDSCRALNDVQVWLVADGMGGHQAGDVASRSIAESIDGLAVDERLSDLIEQVCARIQVVNTFLVAEGRRQHGVIGSTVAALILRDRHAVCIWAGDSRIYRLRNGRIRQLTRDHRWIEEFVDRGLLSRGAADNHPMSNEITRAVGADDLLELSVEMRSVMPGDKYLICSDGLYGEVAESEIEQILAVSNLGDACRELVASAKHGGAHDNVTVIVVQENP
ncbi:MAG: serine/threonine-protein phosphatase [Gammaproteobacteria bacterium]|nr:serine/threonine-protein phosphatase [Gammaproteobacteria bacterium]MCB1923889.1 serine/threonine-protein phosphatase [Gammaproteobacteria bacterium]